MTADPAIRPEPGLGPAGISSLTFQRCRQIIETTNEGIWTIDGESRVSFANPRMAAMLGYEPHEIVGRPLLDFFDEEGRAAAKLNMERRRQGLGGQYDVRYKRKDGTDLWVRLETSPLLGDDGRYEGALAMAMAMDISERRHAEAQLAIQTRRVEEANEALRAAHEELERRVAERTADLERANALLRSEVEQRKSAEAQLRQAQKMEAVGRLAGGVAHDFNNLLSVILSYAQMALDSLPAGDPLREDFEEINKAGTRAAELTAQLLAFSRQRAVQPRVLDLNETLHHMDRMLRRLLGEDIELHTHAGASLRRVEADPGQLEQVVMNLAVNARDAMPGGGALTLETRNVDLDGRYGGEHLQATAGPHVLLAVRDTGTGMDAATQARLFEPFFTTKEPGKGTGLGLATVFGIVQQSGGSIRVRSERGRGTTFEVYLPSVEAPAEAAAHHAPESIRHRGAHTVLLVEDEPQLRQLARGILQRSGYEVLVAVGPADALLLSEQHPTPIDLLLTDVVMPRMNGRQLADRLARSRPEMKVLFMSGYTGNVDLSHGVQQPGAAFLQKPLTPDLLLRAVRGVLYGPTD